MSLLWRTAMVRTATWAPYDSEEDIHPSELEGDISSYKLKGGHTKRLADSIRQHGYDPERHGVLGLNITDNGENLYHHAPGTESAPEHEEPHEHLLQALKDTDHGPVRVHVHDQRSDEDGEEAPRYYHGTTAPNLDDRIHPNYGTRGNFGNNLGIHEPGYAYATSRSNAEHYANMAAMTHGGHAHVYEVSPRGPVETDPSTDIHGNRRGNFADDVRSKHGFQIVGEEDLGHDDEDDEDDEDGWGDEHEHEDW